MLRKDKEKFDVFLLAKDLKTFTKDKRESLLENYPDTEKDQAFIDEDTAREENTEENPATDKNGEADEHAPGTLSKLCTQQNDNEMAEGDQQP